MVRLLTPGYPHAVHGNLRRVPSQTLRRHLSGIGVVAGLAAVAAAVGIYLGLQGGTGVTGLPPFTPPQPASLPTAGEGFLQLGDNWSSASYRGFAYLLVSRSEAAQAAREPGRSLVYFSGTDVNRSWSTGVPYREALAHHWLLEDASGNLLVNRSYPDNNVGDVGNPAYQRAWIANVLAFLRAHHDDGVYIDDVLYDLVPLTGAEAARYPTAASWAAAQLSFVAAAGKALRAHGYYVLVNATGYVPDEPASDDGSNTIRWWRELAPHVNGLLNEFYEETSDGADRARSDGSAWYQHWAGWERLVLAAQSLGKDFVGLTYGALGDEAQMMYGKASFLLDWNGRGGAFIYDPAGGSDPPGDGWTAAVGVPTGAKRRVGSGWLRRYTHGIALVNPDPSTSQRFELGGRYMLPGEDKAVTSVTLAPTSGLVLASAPRD